MLHINNLFRPISFLLWLSSFLCLAIIHIDTASVLRKSLCTIVNNINVDRLRIYITTILRIVLPSFLIIEVCSSLFHSQ